MKIPFGEFYSDGRVIGLEVRNFSQHFECFLGLTRTAECIGNRHVLGARVNDQALHFVERSESICGGRVVRGKLVDLLEHCNRLQGKSLIAIVVRNRRKAGYCILILPISSVKITQHVERGKVIRIVVDDQAIFFDCGCNLSLCQRLFSRTHNLCLIECHWE